LNIMHMGLVTGTHRTVNKSTSRAVALLALAALVGGGCAMNETQTRTAQGAAIGALGGALIGTSRESAAIGAAVGAAGGFLYDQVNQRQDTQSENERLRQENEALRRQQANQ
jgi:osmotically inducible lipoprotein OsmB